MPFIATTLMQGTQPPLTDSQPAPALLTQPYCQLECVENWLPLRDTYKMELLVVEEVVIGKHVQEWFFDPDSDQGFNMQEPAFFLPICQDYVLAVEKVWNADMGEEALSCLGPSLPRHFRQGRS